MRDKRYWYGACVITFIWVSIALGMIFVNGKHTSFADMKLNEIGDFLAGFFAPIGFVWFAAAFLQQGAELRLSREEMSNSVDQFRIQAEALTQTQELEQYKVHMADWARIYDEMNSILSSYIYKFSKSIGKGPTAARKIMERNWEQYSFGDKNTFLRTVSYLCETESTESLDIFIRFNRDKVERFLNLSVELKKLIQPGHSEQSILIPDELAVIENYFKSKIT